MAVVSGHEDMNHPGIKVQVFGNDRVMVLESVPDRAVSTRCSIWPSSA